MEVYSSNKTCGTCAYGSWKLQVDACSIPQNPIQLAIGSVNAFQLITCDSTLFLYCRQLSEQTLCIHIYGTRTRARELGIWISITMHAPWVSLGNHDLIITPSTFPWDFWHSRPHAMPLPNAAQRGAEPNVVIAISERLRAPSLLARTAICAARSPHSSLV